MAYTLSQHVAQMLQHPVTSEPEGAAGVEALAAHIVKLAEENRLLRLRLRAHLVAVGRLVEALEAVEGIEGDAIAARIAKDLGLQLRVEVPPAPPMQFATPPPRTNARIACGACRELVDATLTTTVAPHGIVCDACAERLATAPPVRDVTGYRG